MDSSTHPSIHSSIDYLPIHSLIDEFIRQSIQRQLHLSICTPISSSIHKTHLSVHAFHPSIQPAIHPSIHLFAWHACFKHSSVYSSACLSCCYVRPFIHPSIRPSFIFLSFIHSSNRLSIHSYFSLPRRLFVLFTFQRLIQVSLWWQKCPYSPRGLPERKRRQRHPTTTPSLALHNPYTSSVLAARKMTNPEFELILTIAHWSPHVVPSEAQIDD